MVRAYWLVAKRGKSMAIRKQISIYSNTVEVKRIQQYCNRVLMQGLKCKEFIG